MSAVSFFVVILTCLQVFQGYSAELRIGRGETLQPILLQDNYIPAAMQVMFYLTDHMKYDLKPVSSQPSPSTIRPTPPHKPGNFAPEKPLGPLYFFQKTSLRNRPIGDIPQDSYASQIRKELLPDDIDLLGAGPSELLHQINSLEDFDTVGDEDGDVLRFAINYDDNLNIDYLRQKRVPPTRAYVTLLSLYDLLNKEAKEKGFNKYGGYTDELIAQLAKTSEGTSEDQLRFVLSKMMEKRNTRQANIVKKTKQILEDLTKPDSYLSESLRYIPPLQFLPINP